MLKELAQQLKDDIDSRRYFPGASEAVNALYPKFDHEWSDGWLSGFKTRFDLSFRTPSHRKPGASISLAERQVRAVH